MIPQQSDPPAHLYELLLNCWLIFNGVYRELHDLMSFVLSSAV